MSFRKFGAILHQLVISFTEAATKCNNVLYDLCQQQLKQKYVADHSVHFSTQDLWPWNAVNIMLRGKRTVTKPTGLVLLAFV